MLHNGKIALFTDIANIKEYVNTLCEQNVGFLWAFAELWKATISFVTPVCVCPHETTRLPVDGFVWNLIFRMFRKFCFYYLKIRVLLKSDKNNGYFTWTPMFIYKYISLNSS